MKRHLSLLPLLCLAAAAQTPAPPQDPNAEMLRELSAITGLSVSKPVPMDRMSKAQMRSYFQERIKDEVKPEEIRVQELVMKKFGLAPADFSLEKTTIDLLTEQAAAFYDYKKKRMVMPEDSSGPTADIALVHELAHALADQHFNLEQYIKKSSANDDSALARAAVMEGQATWLMAEYMARKMGQSLKTNPMIMQMMSQASAASGGGFPVLNSVPLYMKESLIFPYMKGLEFQQEVVLKYGQDGFSKVFQTPPSSTQQILHPAKYFEGTKPAPVTMPQLSGGGWKKTAEGMLGEFDLMILFRQHNKESEPLAESWRGGRYQLWERASDKRAVIAYAFAWESPEKSKAAFEAWQKLLQAKWKKYEPAAPATDSLRGAGDDGVFLLRLDGSQFTGLEGLAAATDARAAR